MWYAGLRNAHPTGITESLRRIPERILLSSSCSMMPWAPSLRAGWLKPFCRSTQQGQWASCLGEAHVHSATWHPSYWKWRVQCGHKDALVGAARRQGRVRAVWPGFCTYHVTSVQGCSQALAGKDVDFHLNMAPRPTYLGAFKRGHPLPQTEGGSEGLGLAAYLGAAPLGDALPAEEVAAGSGCSMPALLQAQGAQWCAG